MEGSKKKLKCCERNLWVVFILATFTSLRVGVEWPLLRLEGRVITKGQPNHQQSAPLSFRCSGPQFASRLFCWMPFWHGDGCIGRRMRRTADWPAFYSDDSIVEAPNLSSMLPRLGNRRRDVKSAFNALQQLFSPSRIAISTATAVPENGRE